MYESIAKVTDQNVKSSSLVRYKELDTLRGLAALYVMFFHFSRIAGLDINFLNIGVTGVDLFFIISGYVIFMSLEKTRKPGDFIISRLSRLLPSYLVMMTITTCIIFFFSRSQAPSFVTVLFNTTMLQPWFLVPYIDDSYWTLTIELLFYIGMLYLFTIKRLGNIISIGSITLGIIFLYYLVTSYYLPESKFYILPRYILPITSHLQLFFAGILFYQMKSQKHSWRTYLLLAGCYLLALFFFDKSGRAHFLISFTDYAIAVFIYFIIFYLFVYNKLSFLNVPLLVFFGSISYGIYLLHQKFAIVLYPYLVNEHNISPVVSMLILLTLVIGISGIVTFKIERPVIKYIRNKYIRLSNT